ncbi:leucine-rich repeat domain-containing protein [Neochlamydia sp. AcF95]|uniref:leucine-rich repeat domain-containing protein n=1 Tax=Neochlamydia sp. AcF95 TaxID=2795734 RepID=UPI001BC953AB|nr:leucine-rich repeat domain-containing protein [Neochlamydia sp. AcF95]
MMPPSSTLSTQTNFRTTISENIEDAVSGELMTRAVTLFPCGHTFNEDTVIQCLARNKLCPLDRKLIERHAPNYTVRQLAETAESHPLEELKHQPSEEAVEHFLRGKELAEKGEHATAIEALLQALQLTPTYEKAQAYLEFCLKCSSEASSSLQPVIPHFSSKGKDKEKSLPSTDSPKECYTELLFDLLEESSIQENLILKKILENQVEELMSQENEELTEKEKVSYKWTKKLLGENKKVRQFVIEKLKQIYQDSPSLSTVTPQSSNSISSSSISSTEEIQALAPPSITTISMASLYKAIMQIHFPNENGNIVKQASILDRIYKIEPNLTIEEKVNHIFQKLFNLVTSLSPLEFERDTQESKAFTLSNYSSYLLNIDRLLLWWELPGGAKYLCQPQIKALPLEQKGELLTGWIEEHVKDITDLNLFEISLTFLPPELFQLSQLQWLKLDGSQLTNLPSVIKHLSQLQSLSLNGNQLTSLPSVIGQLSYLQTLDLSHNQLTVIPIEIGRLSQLQNLFLNGNQLTSLPSVIGQLSYLQTLDLSCNKLTALPSTMGQLSQLRNLFLNGNQLTTIPARIRQLPHLWRLKVDGNPL